MTKGEALNILHNASVYHPDYLDALNMAIEALEKESKMEGIRGDIPIQPTVPKMPSIQEPCKDCISRAKVFEQINCWIGSGEYRYTNATNYLLKRIKELQSVNLQESNIKWIPVSERYPNIEDECKYFLVTDDKGNVSVQEFFISLNAEPQPYFSGMINVVAWCELPKPYSEVSE